MQATAWAAALLVALIPALQCCLTLGGSAQAAVHSAHAANAPERVRSGDADSHCTSSHTQPCPHQFASALDDVLPDVVVVEPSRDSVSFTTAQQWTMPVFAASGSRQPTGPPAGLIHWTLFDQNVLLLI